MGNVSDLPGLSPELRLMIFEFLPIRALKNMRLVDKQCNAEAAKLLWADASVTFTTRSQPIEDLLAIPRGGFIENVRELTVKKGLSSDFLVNKGLEKILESLADDCLSTFQCTPYLVTREVFDALLDSQSRLTKLAITLDKTYSSTISVEDIRRSWRNLRYLCVMMPEEYRADGFRDSSNTLCIEVNTWLQHAPLLQHLTVDGGCVNGLRYPILPPWDVLLNLRSFTMISLDLRNLVPSNPTVLDLPQLEVLQLTLCTNSEPLFNLLIGSNNNSICSRLRTFKYEYCRGKHALSAVTNFLQSCRGLTKVLLSGNSPGDIPALNNPGLLTGNLQELRLACHGPDGTYSFKDVEDIVASCTKLERLAISIGIPDHKGDTGASYFRPDDLSPSEDQLRSIGALSTISSLKRLSLVGEFCWELDAPDCHQWRYAQVADQVMARLMEAGSNVEVLDIGSMGKWDLFESVAKYVPGWPHYSYRRGSIVTDSPRRFVKIVAVPVPDKREAGYC